MCVSIPHNHRMSLILFLHFPLWKLSHQELTNSPKVTQKMAEPSFKLDNTDTEFVLLISILYWILCSFYAKGKRSSGKLNMFSITWEQNSKAIFQTQSQYAFHFST